MSSRSLAAASSIMDNSMGIIRRSRKAPGGSPAEKNAGVQPLPPDVAGFPAQVDGEGNATLELPATDPALSLAANATLFAEPALSDRDRRRERRLVEAACRGERSAIEALYRNCYDPIYRYILLRLGSVTAAEDVTSQVFLGMLRGLRRYRDEGKPFLAWLYSIAQKQVALYLRQQNRAQNHVDLEAIAELAADTAGPHATFEERETRAALARALRLLPLGQREVILLRYFLGFSVAETAQAIGRTEGAVKQLQLRALASLKDLLGLGQKQS